MQFFRRVTCSVRTESTRRGPGVHAGWPSPLHSLGPVPWANSRDVKDLKFSVEEDQQAEITTDGGGRQDLPRPVARTYCKLWAAQPNSLTARVLAEVAKDAC